VRSLPEVAAYLDEAAAWVGSSTRDALAAGLPLNEEPVTEFLLLRLKQHLGEQVQITTYTKTQERVSGADWAFYFRLPGQPMWPFRVQAKRARDGRFDLRYGRGPWPQRQIGRLLGQAARDGEIPLYALYSDQIGQAWRSCGLCRPGDWRDWHEWRLPTGPIPGVLPGPGFSVAVLPAGVAFELAINGQTGAAHVLGRTSALACMVRCADPEAFAGTWPPDDGPPSRYRIRDQGRRYPPALAILNRTIAALRALSAAGEIASADQRLSPGLNEALPTWEQQLHQLRDLLTSAAGEGVHAEDGQPQPDRREQFLQQLAGANTPAAISRLLQSRNLHGLAVITVPNPET
jgi:hypothetical protein